VRCSLGSGAVALVALRDRVSTRPCSAFIPATHIQTTQTTQAAAAAMVAQIRDDWRMQRQELEALLTC